MELRLILSVADMGIALISIIFQIVIMGTSRTQDRFEVVGTGLWCGLVFILTALTALKTYHGSESQRENFWANLLVGFSTLSIVCAIAQVLVSSLSIGDRNYYSSLCKLPIVVYECNARYAFDSILIIMGILAIVDNAMLLMLALRRNDY